MWKKPLTKYVSKLPCKNFRIQATKFALPGSSLLIINTYFPCDPLVDNFNDAELVALLADLHSLARQAQCTDVVITGDLNCHFMRQTRFTKLVRNSFEDQDLLIVWQHPADELGHRIESVDYTHCSTARGQASFSTLDHFVTSQRIFRAISEAGVIHSGDNPSNHSPIFLKVKVGQLDLSMESPSPPARVRWCKANSDAQAKYKTCLSDRLRSLALPECLNCNDLHCNIHSEDMEDYTMNVLEAIEKSAEECLPVSGGAKRMSGRKVVAGWAEHVRPYAEESKFWFSVWQSLGKPSQGDVFDNMKLSKNQYKHAVRRIKRVNDKIQNQKFLDSVVNGGVNIFHEIKKFRGSSLSYCSRIDDQVGAKNIANHFADIYSELYNRVELDNEFVSIRSRIKDAVQIDSIPQLDRVNEEVVKEALLHLKCNKHDSLFTIASDCLVNGPPGLVTHLCNLMKMYLSHGSIPNFLLLCTLMPLVKDNFADITASENYRAIAGGSLLLKLLDVVILLLEGDKLGFDQLQFAYQARASTTMCSWTATAVIEHFNLHGSAVYGAAMDMSKAFDLVEWSSLFLTLVDREVEPIFLRLMLYIYQNQMCNVKWSDQYSEMFTVSNGVRQGAVSSAILFAVYIDELLNVLRQAKIGCHIDGIFYGALVFADDILLLSASCSGLQAMVNLCQSFVAQKNLKFGTHPNPDKSKTKCIVFSKKRKDHLDLHPVHLDGVPLPWVSKVKHLGNLLQCDNSMSEDIQIKRGKFIGKVNSLLQEFHFVDSDIMVKLINLYATSFYGSGTWDLFSKECERIFKS